MSCYRNEIKGALRADEGMHEPKIKIWGASASRILNLNMECVDILIEELWNYRKRLASKGPVVYYDETFNEYIVPIGNNAERPMSLMISVFGGGSYAHVPFHSEYLKDLEVCENVPTNVLNLIHKLCPNN